MHCPRVCYYNVKLNSLQVTSATELIATKYIRNRHNSILKHSYPQSTLIPLQSEQSHYQSDLPPYQSTSIASIRLTGAIKAQLIRDPTTSTWLLLGFYRVIGICEINIGSLKRLFFVNETLLYTCRCTLFVVDIFDVLKTNEVYFSGVVTTKIVYVT